MIPPKHRPIAAGLALGLALTPIVTIGVFHGQGRAVKNEAEIQRQSQLEAVAKAHLSNNCYTAESIVVGAEFRVQGRSQSVCIALKDGSRFGFIEYQKEVLTVTHAFSKKDVQAKISTLGKK
jgi:hypothetical protein